MCADREESDQVAKRSVDKLFRVRLNQGMFLVGGAGRSSILASAFMRLEAALKAADAQQDKPLLDTHRDVIETVLCDSFQIAQRAKCRPSAARPCSRREEEDGLMSV
jgi:hypothetical protein